MQQQSGANISVKRTGGEYNEVAIDGKLLNVCKGQAAISVYLNKEAPDQVKELVGGRGVRIRGWVRVRAKVKRLVGGNSR